ncbi:MAG TPA: peptide deformylase [Thermoanaerobaculia bacterium]|nr:peptide deformylase [Thermoanaerobaculia bacterium]
MPVRPIVRLGHPALRKPAQPAAPERIREAELQQLIEDMVETMREAAGVGLAAPQIGIELQVFIYAAEGHPERHPDIPLHVVINPMITPHHRELVYDWEGCLSIPDLRGMVPRQLAVRVQGLDRDGRRLDYVASDFEARIVQHEYDHLNGIVFLDRMRDLRTLGYTEEWNEYMHGEEGWDVDDTAIG